MTVLAVCGLLAILVVAITVGSRFLEARHATQEVVRELQPAADASDSLVVAMADMERGVRGYAMTQQETALEPYGEGVDGSERDLATIRNLLSEHESWVIPLLDKVTSDRQIWLDSIAGPVITDVRSGAARQAVDLTSSVAATQVYDTMHSSAATLQNSIDDRRSEEFSLLAGFAHQLALALSGSLLILLVGLVASVIFMRHSVLTPLEQLRNQLRIVARGGRSEEPIVASGPAELAETGRDAEEMRRQLVTEIDEARMAREGLAQEGPVVAAIRAELTRPQVADVAGVDIFGDLQPAEGVLAGDWWDVFGLPSGRIAIVVADVSGHGAAAGIAGLRLKTTIATVLAADTVLAAGATLDYAALNYAMVRGAALFEETPSRFATCVIVVLDPKRSQLSWCNGGHLSPLLVRAVGTQESLPPTGPLLSALGGIWQTHTIAMKQDDTLLLWTDGLTESRNAAGDQLEESGLCALIHPSAEPIDREPAELVAGVLAAARLRAVDWRRDDVTFIAARFSPTS